jgi:hypothetical protein
MRERTTTAVALSAKVSNNRTNTVAYKIGRVASTSGDCVDKT